MKLFVIIMLAGALATAQTPPAAHSRPQQPAFYDLTLQAASPAATGSPASAPPALAPSTIPPGTTNATAVSSGYVADDNDKLRAGDKNKLAAIGSSEP